MASDTGHFHDVEAFLEQPGGGLVAQVVESEIHDPGPANGANIGTIDRLRGKSRNVAGV